jgi:hypothetical protein
VVISDFTPSSPQNFVSTGLAGSWWLTPVILVTQEAEIKRIKV